MSFEEELKQIDHQIRMLKIQYDLFFCGSRPRPPMHQREEIGEALRKLQFTPMRNAADRFLFNSLINKFNAFQELWMKGTRRMEEGARVHPLAARAAKRAKASREGRRSGESGAAGGRSLPDTGGGFVPTWRIGIRGKSESNIKGLYEGFLAARREIGDARQYSFDRFAREIERQTALVKGKVDCEAVEFRIYCQDKKVTIKARPTT